MHAVLVNTAIDFSHGSAEFKRLNKNDIYDAMLWGKSAEDFKSNELKKNEIHAEIGDSGLWFSHFIWKRSYYFNFFTFFCGKRFF